MGDVFWKLIMVMLQELLPSFWRLNLVSLFFFWLVVRTLASLCVTTFLAQARPGNRRRGSHPLRRPPRRHFCVKARLWPAAFRLQFAELAPGDYHCGLFPLPSPVLRE